MAIDLQDYVNGDTEYIPKLNSNNNKIEYAISQLETQIGAVGAGASAGLLMDALFNGADAIIGPGSYRPVFSGTTANIAPGSAYFAAAPNVVTSTAVVPLSFSGLPSGTYYVKVSTSGLPFRAPDSGAGSLWAIYWSGTAFSGPPTPVANIFYDSIESMASRLSSGLGALESPPGITTFPTLDARLEAIETHIALSAIPRKIGCTVNNTVGFQGAIQIDFAGTIIGWSIIGNASGSVYVDISRKASGVPPAVPSMPDPVVNKISGAAPVALVGAQSASGGMFEVSSWNTSLAAWDVIQFTLAAVSGVVTQATLYLRVRPTGVGTFFTPPLPPPPDFESIPGFSPPDTSP